MLGHIAADQGSMARTAIPRLFMFAVVKCTIPNANPVEA